MFLSHDQHTDPQRWLLSRCNSVAGRGGGRSTRQDADRPALTFGVPLDKPLHSIRRRGEERRGDRAGANRAGKLHGVD